MTSEGSEGLRRLFYPERIAVIGASATPGKIGHTLLSNVIDSGFKGDIHPINPKKGEIRGLTVLGSVLDCHEGPDIALIAVPQPFVRGVIEECGQAGVGVAVIITSGFAEVGLVQEEAELVEIARRYGMRILGPNVFGIYSAPAGVNATFGPLNVIPGNIAVISQSGALGISMMGKTVTEGIGLSAIASIGNRSDIDEVDLLEFLRDDPSTEIIFLYLEGSKRGRRLFEVAREVVKKKPILVVKSGSSARGAKAAASHTGTLAGADRIFDAAFEQAGVQRITEMEDAFNLLRTFSTQPLPSPGGTVIVTNGGGIGVIATDACERHDVPLLEDPEYLEGVFRETMPAYGSTVNPIDITGQGGEDSYEMAITKALNEDRIGGVIGLHCQSGTVDPKLLGDILLKLAKDGRGKKPMTFALIGGREVEDILDMFYEEGLPAFGDPEDAVSSIAALYRRYRDLSRPRTDLEEQDFDTTEIRRIISAARQDGRVQLLETEAKQILAELGLEVVPTRLVRTAEEAVRAANEIGYPVVAKIVSPEIIHKTDVGGVRLNLEDERELREAYTSIMHQARKMHPRAWIAGISISKMIHGGTEVILGSTTDATFGPVIMFGLGGIFVEVLKDVSFRLAPVTWNEASEMIRSIRTAPMLFGARGEKVKDLRTLTESIYLLGRLVDEVTEIAELDINPLRVMDMGEGCMVLDARITLKGPSSGGHHNTEVNV